MHQDLLIIEISKRILSRFDITNVVRESLELLMAFVFVRPSETRDVLGVTYLPETVMQCKG